eukprot:TRINITY_DN919_c9_g1_i1.p1 TRINITY_DN919_c9_g1~~TRINITY_DN919_c9_g1_i1.p1  ORF type:complete len:312 (+),score=55.62 TRINITY_DN919_c9_g1_i1:39-974(+)
MKSLFALATVLTAANAQTSIHQIWTCSTQSDCKTYLAKQSPDTGISCDPALNQCVCPPATTGYAQPDGANNYRQCFPLDAAGATLLGNRRANFLYTMTSSGTDLKCSEIDNFRNDFKTKFQTLVTTAVTVDKIEHFCNTAGTTMYTAVWVNVKFSDLSTTATRDAVTGVRNNIQAQLTGSLTNMGTVDTAALNIYTEEYVRSKCRGTVVGEVLTAAPFDSNTPTVCTTVTCKPGYSLSLTGACVSTPAPFMILRDPNRTPYPIPVWSDDDEMSVDAAVGLTFGILVFIAVMVALYMYSSAAEEKNKKLEQA